MERIVTEVKNGVRIIRFNKPERRNALSYSSYGEIARILNEDAESDDTAVTIFTGTGEYFTSGNDIKAIMESMQGGDADLENKVLKFKDFIEAVINYPKILVAVVNGPAVGIGVTLLGLCDVVYASERATFHTPFVSLGLCAEACASYTFPRIMGRSKAGEVLLLGRKLTAKEACECRLVSQVVPHDKLDELFVQLREYGKLSVNSVRVNKKLIMAGVHEVLCECADREFQTLRQVANSEDFFNGVMSFMARKSKL